MRKKLLFIGLAFFGVFSILLLKPTKTKSAALTTASITLANSRLSYYADLSGAHLAGVNTFTLDTTPANGPDTNTTHLFPGDSISIGVNGGFTVSRVVDSDEFTTTNGLTVSAGDASAIYATQSGTVTIAFTLASDIPAGGYVRVLIPDPASNGNDGAPNTGASLSVNGWDLNSLAAADVSVSGGTGCTWNATEVITAGSGSSHAVDATTTTQCTAGTITMVIGGAGLRNLVNPAKISSGHTVGTADVYQWNVTTYDADPATTGNPIDTVDVSVAPIEGVLISATVDETLTFDVDPVVADAGTTGSCGVTRTASTPDSTEVAIPWGTISSTYLAATHNTSQLLSVSTNADNGYAVTIIENDQMGKDGVTCTGATAGESVSCIQDTTCHGTPCSNSTAADWGAGTENFPGLGYSLEEVTASEAVFEWDDSGTWLAKQIPDQEAGDAAVSIMSNAGPVNASQVYVCYRIDITGTQPAGYYFNKVRYTATAVF